MDIQGHNIIHADLETSEIESYSGNVTYILEQASDIEARQKASLAFKSRLKDVLLAAENNKLSRDEIHLLQRLIKKHHRQDTRNAK